MLGVGTPRCPAVSGAPERSDMTVQPSASDETRDGLGDVERIDGLRQKRPKPRSITRSAL